MNKKKNILSHRNCRKRNAPRKKEEGKKMRFWSESRKRLNCLTTRIMQMGRRSAHAPTRSSRGIVTVQTASKACCNNTGKTGISKWLLSGSRNKFSRFTLVFYLLNAIIASYNGGELKLTQTEVNFFVGWKVILIDVISLFYIFSWILNC